MEKSKELWRPGFHFTPPKGWMNDPNGLVWFQGKYHLFYQYNPYHCNWDSMHWGHAVSDDMIHWEDAGCALTPDQEYDKDPAGGCFSGCPVVKDEKLYLFYTGTVKREGKTVQTQCAAVSEDGFRFEKVKENPLIEAPEGNSEDFRDPKVFWAKGRWRMICGGSDGPADCPESRGRIYLYSSEDLLNWEYNGILLESEGTWGSMFECPDLFQLGDKWFLTASPMYHSRFWPAIRFEGAVDFDNCRFLVEKAERYDWGGRFYAPQTYELPDGRRVAIGWMNGWMWMPWMEDWGPTDKEGWRGCLTLPSEVFLDKAGNFCCRPVKEAEGLWKEKAVEGQTLAGRKPTELPAGDGNRYRLRLEPESLESGQVRIFLMSDGEGRQLELTVDLLNRIMVVDKNPMENQWDKGMVICPLEDGKRQGNDKTDLLEIWVDRSAVEIFWQGGKTRITETVYPADNQYRVFLESPYKWEKLKWELAVIPQ